MVVTLLGGSASPAEAWNAHYLTNYVAQPGFPPECAAWFINASSAQLATIHNVAYMNSGGFCNVWNGRPAGWLYVSNAQGWVFGSFCGGYNMTNAQGSFAAFGDVGCGGALVTHASASFYYWKSTAGSWAESGFIHRQVN